MVASSFAEEVVVIVPEVAAIEEQATATCASLEGEAGEELRLALRQAQVAVVLREVPHALAESENGGVLGAVKDGAVAVRGGERGQRVHRGQEVRDEDLAPGEG